MIDFASALYLGLAHPAACPGRYTSLTTGVPAALAAAPLAGELAARAAALQGCEAGVAAPSTLHLAIDVFDRLGRTHTLVADDGLYPVMRWGLERARGLGAPLAWFTHGNLAELVRTLGAVIPQQPARPPAIITDATLRTGATVALPAYLAAAAAHGGLVVIDHSQVLGVLGERPHAREPWGHGGGGVLVHAGIAPARPVLLVASWAKAFGAPLATLCGPAALIGDIVRDGPTQLHCSAASQAALLAGLDAIDANRRDGAVLRRKLFRFVHRLRDGLARLARTALPDLAGTLPLHPMQQIRLGAPARTLALHAGLWARGFRTALLRQAGGQYAMAVIVRADHRAHDIDDLLTAMAALARPLPRRSRTTSTDHPLFLEAHHA